MSSTLPEAPFPLIGREGDLTLAQALLLRAETRLLTLTGPPGVGKTRLAIEIARQFASASAHGTAFVDLTPIRDPAQFWPAIAQALGVAVRDPATIADRLVAVLRDRPLLLLLDNFEHLAAAASAVARIVEECPGLKILATSREPLHLSWEREFPVKPLPVPDLTRLPEPADLTAFPAVALFVARGQRIDPQFAVTPQNAGAVAELCVRLSGLPLAIELAAARLKVLSPQAMVREVGPRLQFLERITGDLPARHHTMRGAIGWSYQLLSAAEQSLFRSVAVFRGGWT
ncbi:MAG TPA: AAA family ATPase, partial [bacterium]|nr:AAA family ATPase [bacterium]